MHGIHIRALFAQLPRKIKIVPLNEITIHFFDRIKDPNQSQQHSPVQLGPGLVPDPDDAFIRDVNQSRPTGLPTT